LKRSIKILLMPHLPSIDADGLG